MQDVRYEVPEGRDPAVVVKALTDAGFDAAPDSGGPTLVRFSVSGREERERARAVIGQVRTTAMHEGQEIDPHPIRFFDD